MHQDSEKVQAPFFSTAELFNLVVQHLMRKEEAVEQPCVVHDIQNGVLRVEVHAALVVVADLKGVSALDASTQFLLCDLSCQNIEERALAGTVSTYDSHPFISLEVVCELIEVAVVSVVETKVLAVDDFCAEAGCPFEF